MKSLHRPELFAWSRFDAARDLDFHSTFLCHPEGNLVVDPLPLEPHDRAHVEALGGVARIVITNSTHLRDAVALAASTGAALWGPRAEAAGFPVPCARWLGDDEPLVAGVRALALEGSKTPGELALLLDDHTLICGDLVRGPVGGRLDILPDAKLADRARAVASVRRLAELEGLEAVLLGDGWPVFRDGAARLRELLARIA